MPVSFVVPAASGDHCSVPLAPVMQQPLGLALLIAGGC